MESETTMMNAKQPAPICVCCDEEFDPEGLNMTSRCTHEPAMCLECVQRWIEEELGDDQRQFWDQIVCASCAFVLANEDICRVRIVFLKHALLVRWEATPESLISRRSSRQRRKWT